MSTIGILGYGWLGQAVYKHLTQRGYTVKISTSSSEKLNEYRASGLDAYYFDCLNPNGLDRAFMEVDTMVVAISPSKVSDYSQFIEFCKERKLPNLLLISSTSVYEFSDSEVTETSEVQQNTQRNVELQFLNDEGLKTTVLRFGGLFGPGREPHKFHKNRPIPSADSPVNMIHQQDCVQIIEQIIAQEIWGYVFNACAPSHPTKREFYSKIYRDHNKAVPQFSQGRIGKTVFSQKLMDQLNYQFTFPNLLELSKA